RNAASVLCTRARRSARSSGVTATTLAGPAQRRWTGPGAVGQIRPRLAEQPGVPGGRRVPRDRPQPRFERRDLPPGPHRPRADGAEQRLTRDCAALVDLTRVEVRGGEP